ncbi:hypothetical protein TNIN_22681 [Trichonephila inaurata madagascariensis]|uniref:Uncharacterized protein n=1 Tax=Trichonephila inaurata madagascariensis TaxID=2747483 RepID=A0A8X7C6E7_9ARAC|nr:hypothetical protein TNIN_22681 [Trichonephila inaurata madagascariensis]
MEIYGTARTLSHFQKLCTPATATCGRGERQPPCVQWMASVRVNLLNDQGIPSAKRDSKDAGPLPKILHPKEPLFQEVANVKHPMCNGGLRSGKTPL